MPAGKPIVATAAELEEAEARLQELIKKVQQEASSNTSAAEIRLKASIDELSGTVNTNAGTGADDVSVARTEAKEYTEECVAALHAQLLTFFPPIEEDIKVKHEEVNKLIEETDTKLQQLIVDELSALASQFDEELTNVKNELTQNLQDWGREAAEALVNQRKELDETIEKLRIATAEDRARIREETRMEFEQRFSDQRASDFAQDEARKELRRDIESEILRIEGVIMDKEAKAHNHAEEVAANAEANRKSLAEYNLGRLVRLDGECQQLREGLREVENVTTRRVEWVIREALTVLTPPPEGWSPERNHRSFFSPRFNGAGAWGLQLELQLLGPPKNDSADQGPRSGNLAIYLWACQGTRLAVKLFIGERAIPLDKKFTGTEPLGTGRFCFLKDSINEEDGTLRLGVDFLEAMREVEYANRLPPPPMSITGKCPGTEIEGVNRKIAEIEGEMAEVDENHLAGSLCFMRHLSHRVIDQVTQQVNGMESRMVRKVEWLLQNASKLKRRFNWGQAMCSPCFSAAGVDNMQFALYPCGYGAVTDGFCSLFLYCNAGVTLHCFLSMQKQSTNQIQTRELVHTWEEPGAFGRTNFCLFDQVIDEVDDTVIVSLEIESAQQEIITPWIHQEADKGPADKSDPTQSLTKLTRNPGKAPNGRPNGRDGKLDTQMRIASIWTAKPFCEGGSAAADIPDGFHSFDEVLHRRPAQTRPDTDGKKKGPKSPGHSTMRMQRHESAPTMKPPDASLRTAMQEDLPDLSPPLPSVTAGSITLGAAAGGWDSELPPGGASSFGQAKKAAGRRPRPASSEEARAIDGVKLGGTY